MCAERSEILSFTLKLYTNIWREAAILSQTYKLTRKHYFGGSRLPVKVGDFALLVVKLLIYDLKFFGASYSRAFTYLCAHKMSNPDFIDRKS